LHFKIYKVLIVVLMTSNYARVVNISSVQAFGSYTGISQMTQKPTLAMLVC